MNKYLLLLLLLSALTLLKANTIIVSPDGSQHLTSIQLAVDVSADGDTILVYPGRYLEHIDIIDKSLTIQGHYALTNNWDDVENTIIDADFQSNGFRLENNANATINGFLIENGVGYHYFDQYIYGGGILVYDSSLNLLNCIVQNCTSVNSGGIGVYEDSYVNLSSNIIRNNRAIYQGGGIGSSGGATVEFDPVNLNSIYNNYGSVQEIYIYNSICNDIVLDTLSVNLTGPDGFFVSYYSGPNPTPPTITVQNEYFNQIDSDIYVSPDGNDSNDGLTPETALQTIAYATRLVQPNVQNPNTVYLLPGVYSKDLNNQFFPVAVQSNTNLLGAGETPAGVVIGEEWNLNTVSIWFAENVEVGNFQMRRNNIIDEKAMSINVCQNIFVRDIDFGEAQTNRPGIGISRSHAIEVNNCSFHDIIGNNGDFRCFTTYTSDVYLNNVMVYNNSSTSNEGHVSCFDFDDSSIEANNIIIANNHQDYPGILMQYANIEGGSVGGNLNLTNFLMYNNISTDNSHPLLVFVNRYDHSYINNMTIAHNTGPTGVLRLAGDYTVRNSILYNPYAGRELTIWEPSSGDSHPIYSNIDADYNLMRGGLNNVIGADNPNNTLTWGEHNLDTDPLFRGDVTGDIPFGDFRR
ncbi:MAG: hypothetical protein JXR56_07215, partial [Candidatus Cloacimonetes bacterium]|nr:hypothetical protein [Candidatus Cloacimonadota bacterium]